MTIYTDLLVDINGIFSELGTKVVVNRNGTDIIKSLGVFGPLDDQLSKLPNISATSESLLLPGDVKTPPQTGDTARRLSDGKQYYVGQVVTLQPGDTVLLYTCVVDK